MADASHNSPAADGAVTQVNPRGTVRIAPAVLMELIELTVQDIEGIAGLRPHRYRRAGGVAPGAKSYDNGKTAVTVQGDQIDAAVALAINKGVNVSGLSAEIQKRIGFAAGNMLGMTVRTVDIYIEEIIPGPAPA